MAFGRGIVLDSTRVLGVALLCLSLLLVHLQLAESTEFTVGDDKGWSFSVEGWPKGKSFNAGDVLVFKYNLQAHNVVSVGDDNYEHCTVPLGGKVFMSGNDNITLNQGDNYFICGIPGHCQQGMRIAVNAA